MPAAYPPSFSVFSTMVTSYPVFAASRAVYMPVTPPPRTRIFLEKDSVL